MSGGHAHPPLGSAAASALTQRAALLAVAVALLLLALKGWAWLASGSVAMLAALADSALDLAASLVTYFAARYAASPPDREHRFGHGKAEAFAGLLQAGLVVASAALVAVEAARRLAAPAPLAAEGLALGVILASIALTAGLVIVQTRIVAKTGSVATKGDRAHYVADLAGNLAVVAGLLGAWLFGWRWADPVAGLFVAGWLCWGAWRVAAEAGDHLMDRELPEADRARIEALALEEPGVQAVHDLRTRASGPHIHIQFHADLDPNLTLGAAHGIMVGAEARIRAAFPAADVIVHPDPRGAAAPHGHESFRDG